MRQGAYLRFACLFVFGLLLVSCGEGGAPVEAGIDPDDPDRVFLDGAVVEGSVLRVEPGRMAERGGEWLDFELSFLYHPVGDGILEIGLRAAPASRYVLAIEGRGISLLKDLHEERIEIAATPLTLDPDIWHEFFLILEGGNIAVFHFGELVMEFADPDPLPPGGLTFETIGDLTAEIDNPILAPIETGELSVEPPPEEPPSQATTSEPAETVDTTDLAPPLPVSEWEWVRLGGPPGGTGYDIRYNFDDPDIWYVTDANTGVHISTDNGLSWHESNSGLPGLTGPTSDAIGIFCLTVDPHDPSIIWIGTIGHGHVYRSTDGGLTWEARENGIEIEFDQLTIRGFTVDPRSSDIVYMMAETNDDSLGGPTPWLGGVGGVVYKTTDAGENWIKIWDGGMPSSLARYMWIDPRDPDVLYVSTGIFDRSAAGEEQSEEDPWGGLGILKSTDGGATWEILGKENGLRNLYIGSLYMHPDDPDVLLAAAGHGGGPSAEAILGEMMLTGQGSPMGVYRTEDGGETWEQTLIANELEVFSSVELCPSEPDIGYAATKNSMYRTDDAGLTWTLTARPWSPSGILAGFPIDMQCDPRDPDRVFVNNYGGGNYLSEDGGETWVSASDGYTGAQIFDISFASGDPQVIYAESFGGVWRSDDGGQSWVGIRYAQAERDAYRFMATDPEDSQHIFSGQYSLVESFDGGLTWQEVFRLSDYYDQGISAESTLSGIPVLAYAPSKNDRIYVGFGHELCALNHEPTCMVDNNYRGPGVIYSEDEGDTWTVNLDSGLGTNGVMDLAVDYSNPDILYAATTGGLYRSTDGAESWGIVSGLPEGLVAYSVAVDPNDSSHLLVGMDRDGIYQSLDGGNTWQNVSNGLEPNGSFSSIVFDRANPGVVYGSDLLSGVYRSEDGGNTWTKINNGLHSRAISEILVSANGNHLYAGSNEDGMYRLDLNGISPTGSE